MPQLVLGPILRHIGTVDATLWVETDVPCEVEVLDAREPTFAVDGRHYALVVIDGLDQGSSHPYEVRLDGERVWPDPGLDLPPSSIRTLDPARPLKLVFGSCRRAAPHEPPWTDRRSRDERGLGIDALRTLAIRTTRQPEAEWPDALLMLGDQIYADEPSPRLERLISARQVDPDAPRDQVEDLTEYALAYCNAWSERYVRWFLSTVPSAMIFDDHEIHDAWNISKSWVEEMRAKDWYGRRINTGIMSYWLYQHLGNMSPAEIAEDEVLAAVRRAPDGVEPLREFARDAEHETARSRWSFCRDLGQTRVIVLDSRGNRVLEPGRRQMLDDEEWRWVEERVRGDFDHLVLASSLPFVVHPGLHWLEVWNERVCDGAWGERAAKAGERFRRGANLDHWAAFHDSFMAIARLVEEVATGRHGTPPQTIVLLSGDVHHCYLAEIAFRRGAGVQSRAWQAVSSGLRKQLDAGERRAAKAANSAFASRITRSLARAAGAPEPPIAWRLVDDPVYENQIGTLALGDGAAHVRVESPAGSDWRDPTLRPVLSHSLLPDGAPDPLG